MEPGRSSSTVGQSRESLDRGAGILSDVARRGVVKTENAEDEQEILKANRGCIPETLNPKPL